MLRSDLIRSKYMMGRRSVQHATMSNAMLLAGPLRPKSLTLPPIPSGLERGCSISSPLSSSEELDSESAWRSASISESPSRQSPSGDPASDRSGDSCAPCKSITSESRLPCVACWWRSGSGGGGEGNKLRCSAHKSLQMTYAITIRLQCERANYIT